MAALSEFSKRIHALNKAEELAIYAVNIKNWQLALEQYDKVVRLCESWLSEEDPNVLWAKTHLSEALVELGKLDEAAEFHLTLLKVVTWRETQEEIDVLEQVLHLKVDVANKLLAQKKYSEALQILQEAVEFSKQRRGPETGITVVLRDIIHQIKDEMLRKDASKSRRKVKGMLRDNAATRSDGDGPAESVKHYVADPSSPQPSHSPHSPHADDLEPDTPYSVVSTDASQPRVAYTNTFRLQNLGQHEQDIRYESGSSFSDKPAASDFSDAELLGASDESISSSSDKWFSKYLKQTHTLLKTHGDLKPSRRPSIAILDTGLNTAHPDVVKILNPKALEDRRIKGFWAPSSGGWIATEDLDGHGTHCAMVAHKTAPDANIYIAKVFEDRKNVDGRYVTEAITHAVEKWNVDIISMSFAISKDDEATKAAMKDIFSEIQGNSVNSRTVLLFAAASNSGKNESRTFPAKLPATFAIHAADGAGQAWPKNPRGRFADRNFMTLGVDVSAPHKANTNVRLSGTSIACPVAAGIAALVIEFCRKAKIVTIDPITDGDVLKSKEGMESIFLKMCSQNAHEIGPKREDYAYLMPWGLMSLDRGDGNPMRAWEETVIDIKRALKSLKD